MKYRNNVLLQFCNVWWLGGTSLFVLDIIKAFPEMHHIVCYRSDSKVNHELTDMATGEYLAEVLYMQKVTRKFLDDKQPFVTIAHNLPSGAYEKDDIKFDPKTEFYKQFGIVKEYPIISWHHSAVKSWIPTAAHIFNSIYTEKMYKNLHKHMEYMKVIPPCIDVDTYSSVRREMKKDVYNFGIVDNWNNKKFSPELFVRIISEMEKHNKLLGKDDVPWHLHIVTSRSMFQKYRGNPTIHVYNFEMDLRNFYGLVDCMIYYPEIKDTWGRVLTEAMASGCSLIVRNFGGLSEQLVGLKDYAYPAHSYENVQWLMKHAYRKGRDENYDHTMLTEHARKIAGHEVLRAKLTPLMLKIGNGDW